MRSSVPGRVRMVSAREAHAKVQDLHLRRFKPGKRGKLLAGAGGRGPVLVWKVKGAHPHHAKVARALGLDPRQFVAAIISKDGRFYLHRTDGLFAPAPADPRPIVASIEAAHPLTWGQMTVDEARRDRDLREVLKVDWTLMLPDGIDGDTGMRL